MQGTSTVYQLGEGHSRYIVLCDSDNCMDVFDEPLLPKIGAVWHGKQVRELRATAIKENVYLVEVEMVTMANAGESVPCANSG